MALTILVVLILTHGVLNVVVVIWSFGDFNRLVKRPGACVILAKRGKVITVRIIEQVSQTNILVYENENTFSGVS